MKDFTLSTYRNLLLAIRQSGYDFYTFEDWCDGKANGRFVILRHDVDLKAINSLSVAKIEAETGIRATYYFRSIPQSNKPDIIKAIAELGHEIGYHYEDLSLFHGNVAKAMNHFKLQLNHFRQFYTVRTICMHGSPTSKWDNRDLWKTYSYRDCGVIGEPYLDFLSIKSDSHSNITYFTDTARMWDGADYNFRDKLLVNQKKLSSNNTKLKKPILEINNFKIHSTFDLINWLKTNPSIDAMMITTHPQRWTDNSVDWMVELLKQNFKNLIKKMILKLINNRKYVSWFK